MNEIQTKKIHTPKKTLGDFPNIKEVITGKEVFQNLKEKEIRQKEFNEAAEVEKRNQRR